MSTQLSGQLIEQMLQGFTPQPWAHVRLHTGEPPRDVTWRDAPPVRFESAWTDEIRPAWTDEIGIMLGAMPEAAFGDATEPVGILSRIDGVLEDWERGEDAATWRPE